ncbi:MAG: copper transporter [Acidimicrobiales bacterium]
MINLRYHIVSLMAVFLALALGVVMGSTVIDRAIVDGLENQVNSVGARATRTANENRALRDQLNLMQNFAQEARDQLVEGHLRGVPVLVIVVQGIDRKPVEALREALATAEAIPAGTLLLTNKLRLDNDTDIRSLGTTLSLNSTSADAVRGQFVSRVAGVLDGSVSDSNVIPALAAAGFLGYEPPASTPTTAASLGLTSFPVGGLRMVLVSGAGAEVSDDGLARPLSEALSQGAPNRSRLVVAESGVDTPGGRAVFVGPLRADGSLGPRLSTVDNLETPVGQAAVVLALEDLARPTTGHYGVGPGADRLLPAVEQ